MSRDSGSSEEINDLTGGEIGPGTVFSDGPTGTLTREGDSDST